MQHRINQRKLVPTRPKLPPKTNWKTGSGLKPIDCAPCTRNVIPCQNKRPPSVTMKDGMANCSVISPFNAPIRVPSTIATAEAIQTEMDMSFIIIAAATETNVEAVPTDKSNSPAIIRTPTPKATIPSDGIACSITEMLGPDRYLKLVGAISPAATHTIWMATKTTRMLASVVRRKSWAQRVKLLLDIAPEESSGRVGRRSLAPTISCGCELTETQRYWPASVAANL